MPTDWNLDTTTTLGAAMQQMRALAPAGDMSATISPDNARSLEQHDAVHILFNCGTSVRDEIAVHVWMMCATTIDLGAMHHTIADREHQQVLAGIGHWQLAGIWLSSLPRILSIIFKSWQMSKKLAIADLNRLKQQSVLEIRREYGIVV